MDLLMLGLHLLVILVNVFGWLFSATRKIQFLLIHITAFSWLVLGFFWGWGYCFLTDWHWEIKRARGEPVAFTDFFSYYLNQLGFSISDQNWVPTVVGTIFFLVFLISHLQYWKIRLIQKK